MLKYLSSTGGAYVKISLKSLILALMVAVSLNARQFVPINIDKGEMFDDNTEDVMVALSEENVGGGASTSLKITYPPNGGWAGFWMPKKSAWTGFSVVRFFAFNPADKKIKMAFVIKDKNHKGGISGRGKEGWDMRKTWAIIPFSLDPGMNEIKLSIEDLKTQEGRDVDFSRIFHWGFYYRFFPEHDWEEKDAKTFEFYLSKFRLTTEE